MEQLSRRLHQFNTSGRKSGGIVLSAGSTESGMADYKITRKLKPEVAAYIAGLIDGEGTITLSRRHANEHRQLVVSIANTELPLLEFVLEQTGTGKITRKRTVSVKHTPSFCYSVSNRQALALLRQLQPYLRSYKRQRAQLIVANYEHLTPRNGKYTPTINQARVLFEQALLATRPH